MRAAGLGCGWGDDVVCRREEAVVLMSCGCGACLARHRASEEREHEFVCLLNFTCFFW